MAAALRDDRCATLAHEFRKVGQKMTQNATQFQVGDVVRLKSGGPEMAVKRLMGVGVDCVWFEGDRLADGAWFESALLTRVENPRL